MNPAVGALRDQVAAVLRDLAPHEVSTEALAARLDRLPTEVHSHLRALKRRAHARRDYSTDYQSVYWRWTGPVDSAIDAFEAALGATPGEA